MIFGWWDIIILVSVILVGLGVGFYFLNKWAGRRASQQQEMVEQHKQTVQLYVIDKKKDKITNANFPKAMADQMPRLSKMMKMPLVKVKIGAQIMTMLCEKDAFEALPVKKTVTVEIAGAYIVSMKGMKTKLQMAEMRKARRKGAKSDGTSEPQPKWYKRIFSR